MALKTRGLALSTTRRGCTASSSRPFGGRGADRGRRQVAAGLPHRGSHRWRACVAVGAPTRGSNRPTRQRGESHARAAAAPATDTGRRSDRRAAHSANRTNSTSGSELTPRRIEQRTVGAVGASEDRLRTKCRGHTCAGSEPRNVSSRPSQARCSITTRVATGDRAARPRPVASIRKHCVSNLR
jgi:hypothetical protein